MNKRMWWYWTVWIALLFLASCQAPTTMAPSPLPGIAVPVLEDSRHIPYLGADHIPYNSTPPTSGPHVPQTVAPGIYREEIAEELQVHALEHGHVLIQFAPAVPTDEIRVVAGVARWFPRDVIAAPYGKLRSGLALTAWGRIEYLEHADADRIVAFVTSLAGRYDHGWKRP